MVIEDLHSGTQRHLTGHAEEISTLALQHDGLFLASASGPSDINSSQICLWNIQEGVCKKVNNYCISTKENVSYLCTVDYKPIRFCTPSPSPSNALP